MNPNLNRSQRRERSGDEPEDHFKCFRCGDGLTPLYCLNCAKAMNDVLAAVQVGKITISRLRNGHLWLSHVRGEGMELSKQEKLGKLLEEFFRKEF